MEKIETDCVVVGAGIIGLAVARELAQAGREIVILEAEAAIGTGNSSRNSEVIHAGLYYPTGSLKAKFCVAGRERLYRYCQERNVAHRRIGKLIVATRDEQASALEALLRQAQANGVHDLERLTGGQARALEPEIECRAALLSPSTGIVDSHGLMLSILGEAQEAGAMLALRSRVAAGRIVGGGTVELDVIGAPDVQVRAKTLINCAGLGAQSLARSIEGFPTHHVPRLCLAKGSYFALRGRAPFKRLIYPVPEEGGLGIHLTLDLAGAARFGPDVEWIERPNHIVDPARGENFVAAIKNYWPGIEARALDPAHCGIRPKLSGPNEGNADFAILGPKDHGAPGQVHLFGIESPGLTSALAIADAVARME